MASLALCARTPAEAQTTSTRVARETKDLGEQSSTCRASSSCTGAATRRAERLALGSRMVSGSQRFAKERPSVRAASRARGARNVAFRLFRDISLCVRWASGSATTASAARPSTWTACEKGCVRAAAASAPDT